MQEKKWIRVGLAAVIVGGAMGALSAAGCSGDDNANTGGKDSGSDHTSSSGADSSSSSGGDSSSSSGGDSSGGPKDGSGDVAETGPTVPNAKVFLVHGAVDPLAPPFRFCFGIDSSAAGDGSTVTVAGGIAPFPDVKVSPSFPVAGLFPGLGGSTASSPKLSTFDLSTLTIALYAIDATKIASDVPGPDGGGETPCEGIIGSDAKGKGGAGGGTITLGTDYWYVGTIPKGTLAHGTTWVADVAGCVPGETGQAAALCGTGYDAAKGNLKIVPYKLDNSTVIDAGIGAQFAVASSQWAGVIGTAGGQATVAGFLVPNTLDAGGTADSAPPPVIPEAFSGPAMDDGKLYPATLASVQGVTFDKNTTFFAQAVGADGGAFFFPPGCTPGVSCAGLLPMDTLATLSGTTFANNQGYVFLLVGDPSAAPFLDDAGTIPNTKFAHFLGFPTSNP